MRRHSRKVDLESGPSSLFAVYPDVAARLPDDAVNHRQSKTGPLPLFLRREEWLEDVQARCLAHAATGIADRQHHVITRNHRNMFARIRLVEIDVARFDRQLPASRHRIASVN